METQLEYCSRKMSECSPFGYLGRDSGWTKKQKLDPFVAVGICADCAGTSAAFMSPRLARMIFADPAVTAPAFSGLFGSDVFPFCCHRLNSVSAVIL
jgi:hypothetical protein